MIRRTSALCITSVSALALSVVLLIACSQESEEQQATAAKDATSRPNANARANSVVDPDMVSAPAVSKQPGQVELKFAVAQKPEVGHPVDIRLALIPAPGVERMVATFAGSDGLELRSGGATPAYEKPEGGAAISHTLTVVPNADGIFYVTATVTTDSETSSLSRMFSIPLIAGEGLPAAIKPTNPGIQPLASAPAAKQRQSK
jgi:hypothetical protein